MARGFVCGVSVFIARYTTLARECFSPLLAKPLVSPTSVYLQLKIPRLGYVQHHSTFCVITGHCGEQSLFYRLPPPLASLHTSSLRKSLSLHSFNAFISLRLHNAHVLISPSSHAVHTASFPSNIGHHERVLFTSLVFLPPWGRGGSAGFELVYLVYHIVVYTRYNYDLCVRREPGCSWHCD